MDRIMIAIPCMDEMDTGFVKSLVNLKPEGLLDISFEESSLVYLSRENLCKRAIEGKFDWVLWLDSDMIFSPLLLHDLLEDDKDFVTSLFFRRRHPYTPALWKKLRVGLNADDMEVEGYDDYPEDEVFEIEACGMAATLMRVDVIKAVVEKYGRAFAPMNGFGEDLSFCIRARACGFKLFCDSRLKVGHMSKTVVTEETFKAYSRTNDRHRDIIEATNAMNNYIEGVENGRS